MTDDAKPRFGRYWHLYGGRLARRGWPILSIIPPGATISRGKIAKLTMRRDRTRDEAERRRLDREIAEAEKSFAAVVSQRGKVPGEPRGSGWWTIPAKSRPGQPPGWFDLIVPPPTLQVRERCAWQPAAGIGLALGSRLPDGTALMAVDNDVRLPELANALDGSFLANVTCFAPSRVGAWPKTCRLIRVPVHEGMKAPTVIKTAGYVLPGDHPKDKAHAVEILGYTKQIVVYGMHPSGVEYQWPDVELTELAPADLPVVEVAELRRWLATADVLFREAGARARQETAHGGGERRTRPRDELRARDPAHVTALFRQLPNADLDYHAWVAVAYALVGALGHDGETCELWHEFSAKSDKYDPDQAEAVFAGIRANEVRSGAGSIVRWAREAGIDVTPPAPVVREPPTMAVAEARRHNAALMGEAFARVERYHARRRTAASEAAAAAGDEADDGRLREESGASLTDAASLFDDPDAEPPPLMILGDLGLGKTEAALRQTIAFLKADPERTVAVAVSAHLLGEDVAPRADALAGEPLAAVWRGLEQPDPDDPSAPMCRWRPEIAELLQALGPSASINRFCGGPRRGHCRYHPDNPARVGPPCGHQRQRRRKARLWIVPVQMLPNAVPDAMRREGRAAFDLVVVDEGIWLDTFLVGADRRRHPHALALASLTSPYLWAAQPGEKGMTADERELARAYLADLRAVLEDVPDGPVPREAVHELPEGHRLRRDLGLMTKLIWKAKVDVEREIAPHLSRPEIAALAQAARRNVLVGRVAKLLALLQAQAGRPDATTESIVRQPVRDPHGLDVPGLALAWRGVRTCTRRGPPRPPSCWTPPASPRSPGGCSHAWKCWAGPRHASSTRPCCNSPIAPSPTRR
jgi:hypothetical protein